MASTAGARFLADSAIWMASQEPPKLKAPHHLGTLIETALQHMDDERKSAFLRWLEAIETGITIKEKAEDYRDRVSSGIS